MAVMSVRHGHDKGRIFSQRMGRGKLVMPAWYRHDKLLSIMSEEAA